MAALTILARTVALEARRTGLPWLALVCLATGVALAAFLAQVAITEQRALQLSLTAAYLRLCAAFLMIVFVAVRTAREASDKGLELMLSLPLSRTVQYLGRATGFGVCAAALAFAFALPLAALDPPGIALLMWSVSLALEVWLVAVATLFFSMALMQPLPAMTAAAGFYLLGRAMTAIQAIAVGPMTEPGTSQAIARWTIDAIAALLPRLDAVTRVDWLVYAPPAPGEFARLVLAMVLYCALLLGAGLVDFHRRNL